MSSQRHDLKDKVVLITGGGGGVGFECALQFAHRGGRIMIIGRDKTRLSQALERLPATDTYALAGDVSDPAFARQVFAQAQTYFSSPVSVLVNNAGIILRAETAATSDDAWRKLIDINVSGVFYFSRAFACQKVDSGAIVNVSSTCGLVGAAGLGAYCASKGAVIQLTRAMALELAPRQITVNAVAPGAINTSMLYAGHKDEVEHQEIAAENCAAIPIGALAEPQDVARSIVFLASEGHITGSILSVDGGYTAL